MGLDSNRLDFKFYLCYFLVGCPLGKLLASLSLIFLSKAGTKMKWVRLCPLSTKFKKAPKHSLIKVNNIHTHTKNHNFKQKQDPILHLYDPASHLFLTLALSDPVLVVFIYLYLPLTGLISLLTAFSFLVYPWLLKLPNNLGSLVAQMVKNLPAM